MKSLIIMIIKIVIKMIKVNILYVVLGNSKGDRPSFKDVVFVCYTIDMICTGEKSISSPSILIDGN